jgi:hypothetical protein
MFAVTRRRPRVFATRRHLARRRVSQGYLEIAIEAYRRGQPFRSYSPLSRAATCSTISRRSASSTDPSCTIFTFQLLPSG